MMPAIGKFVRRVAANIPGTEASARAKISATKRRVEKALRADGWSRAAANAEVARRFRDGTL